MDNILESACQHPGCLCVIGEDYCGEYCRSHAGHTEDQQHPCECGHDACKSAAME